MIHYLVTTFRGKKTVFSYYIPVPSCLNATEIIFLPKNTPSVIQPVDGGIIRCLKVHYRRFFMEKILKRLDAGLENSAQDASKTVSVLDAIHHDLQGVE